ncbi:MAG: PspC domain-containing protein [Anaerolineales bacterium]|jgi:phage shock protein C
MKRRLFRSENERVLGGVCGGLGDYLGIDPVFIRIFFIIWTVLGEFSVLVYILLWVVIPNESEVNAETRFTGEDIGARFRLMGQEISQAARQPSSELITFVGVGLIAWGAYYLLQRIGLTWIPWDYTRFAWPALLIAAGAFVLVRTIRKK